MKSLMTRLHSYSLVVIHYFWWPSRFQPYDIGMHWKQPLTYEDISTKALLPSLENCHWLLFAHTQSWTTIERPLKCFMNGMPFITFIPNIIGFLQYTSQYIFRPSKFVCRMCSFSFEFVHWDIQSERAAVEQEVLRVPLSEALCMKPIEYAIAAFQVL